MRILDRYIAFYVFKVFIICLGSSIGLFLIIDFFEHTRVFFREETTILSVFLYLLFKIPLIVHLMIPISILVSVLISIGRLSQVSEITAMRGCGLSVSRISVPVIFLGFILSIFMMIFGETVLPWSMQRFDRVYKIDIRKRAQIGELSRSNFWYRDGNIFYRVGHYDSAHEVMKNFSKFLLAEDFKPIYRTHSLLVEWIDEDIGWLMREVLETSYGSDGRITQFNFDELPLVIEENPVDFYNKTVLPETMSWFQLKDYIAKLQRDGVPVLSYIVKLKSKLSFPFVTLLVSLVAVPFALVSARTGTMTLGFIFGVMIGFSYYVVHAIFIALGSSGKIPATTSAWATNILLLFLGLYLLLGAERAK